MQTVSRCDDLGDGLDLDGWFTETEAEVYRSLVQRIRCGIVVEVGVWKGRSISAILDVCRTNQNRVYAVDTWRPDPRDAGYREAVRRDIAAVFRDNVARLGHATTVEILHEESRDAARLFFDRSVDLAFIDADHSYKAVIEDLRNWLPKVCAAGRSLWP